MSTVGHRNHHNSFASILSYPAGIVSKDSALLQLPLAPVKVQIGSADAARLKLHPHPASFDFGFRDFVDFDVVGSMVNSGFQKESTSNK